MAFSCDPILGAGLGLRSCHYQQILQDKPDVPWFELLSDNYMAAGGLPLLRAEQIRKDYPITLHGVGMSLGSADPLNISYLTKLKALAKRLQPTYISDHLAWVAIAGKYTHDLLPLPYTEATLRHISDRINQAQDILGCTLLLENPSTYLTFTATEMTEWEFIQAVVASTGCDLLLDVNNIYVSATNHGFDPYTYLEAIPVSHVKEIHLAGYEKKKKYLLDTHGYQVHPPVWELYRAAIRSMGSIPTLIEWDTDIPPFATLYHEAVLAEQVLTETR